MCGGLPPTPQFETWALQRRIMYIHVCAYKYGQQRVAVVVSRITKSSYKDILLLAPSSKIPSQVSGPKKLLVFMLAFML